MKAPLLRQLAGEAICGNAVSRALAAGSSIPSEILALPVAANLPPSSCIFLLAGSFLVVGLSGCQWEPSRQVAASETPVIPVSHPVQREVTDYVDFTGSTGFVLLLVVWPKGGAVALAAFREGIRQPMFWLLFAGAARTVAPCRTSEATTSGSSKS